MTNARFLMDKGVRKRGVVYRCGSWAGMWRVLLSLVMVVFGAGTAPGYELRVVNTSEQPLDAHPVTMSVADLPQATRRYGEALTVVDGDGNTLPSQVDDLDGDGQPDELVFLVELSPTGAKQLRLTQDGDRNDNSALRVTDQQVLVNSRLRVVPTHEGGAEVEMFDTRSGDRLLRRLMIPELSDQRFDTSVVASGPVRAIVDRSVPLGDGLHFTQRYMVYRYEYGVRMQFIFDNRTDGERDVPLVTKNRFIRTELGTLIARDIRQTDVLSVNWWETTRKNVAWINKSTGYAVGYSYHSPGWRHVVRREWANAARTIEGIEIHSRQGKIGWKNPTPRHWTLTKDGQVFLGAYRHFAPRGSYFKNKKENWRGRPRTPTVAGGSRRTFAASIYFYSGGLDDAVDGFSQDHRATVGLVNAYGEDNRVLSVAGAPYSTQEEFNPARWLTSGDVTLSTRNGTSKVTAPVSGGSLSTWLTRDFTDPAELRGTLQTAENTAVHISLKNIITGEVFPIRQVEEDFRLQLIRRTQGRHPALRAGYFDVAKRLGVENTEELSWRNLANLFEAGERLGQFGESVGKELFGEFPAKLQLKLVPVNDEATGPLSARIDRLALGYPTPQPPKIESPPTNFPLTDIAVMFRLASGTPEEVERGYEVEVARSKKFASPIARYREVNALYKTNRVPSDVLPDDPKKFTPGQYYVRARAIGIDGIKGAWTDPRPFTVSNQDYTTKPVRQKISARKPMIHLHTARGGGASWPDDTIRFWNEELSPELRKLCVAERGAPGEGDLVKELGEAEINTFPRVAGHTVDGIVDLANLERLLARHDNLLGWKAGEGGTAHPAYQQRYVKLAAKYGAYHGGAAEGAESVVGAHPGLYEMLKEYDDYYFGIKKSQNPYSPLRLRNFKIGLWLAGRAGAWGQETEWHMPKKVKPKPALRGIDMLMPWLMGLSYGAQVYRIEGFISDNPTWPHMTGWSPKRQKPGHLWTRAVEPFLQDVIKHNMIPTRQDVLDEIKVAFQVEKEHTIRGARQVEPFPRDIFQAVHGIPTLWRQWVPDKTDYYLVPLMPYLATEEDLNGFEEVVSPSKFYSTQGAVNYFDLFYDEQRSEAFAVHPGDTGVITNSEESRPNWNYRELQRWPLVNPAVDASPQYFYQEFTKGPVRHIDGEVQQWAYYLTKQYDDRLFIHVNNYESRRSQFTAYGHDALQVEVHPSRAVVSRRNRDSGKEVTLTLNHKHKHGAVRIYLRSSQN